MDNRNYEKMIREYYEYLASCLVHAAQNNDKVSEESYKKLIIEYLTLIAKNLSKDFKLKVDNTEETNTVVKKENSSKSKKSKKKK